MSRKKLNVVELNKKEEKIVLEEKQSPLLVFWRKNSLLLFITALILSLTILFISMIVAFKNIKENAEETIKEVSIETTLDNYTANVTIDNNSMTEDTAKDKFIKNQSFKSRGEVLLTKIVDNEKYTIKYYSDGMVIRVQKNTGIITRIKPLSPDKYGINKDGTINPKAITSIVTVKETKEYPWGKAIYYSDGSAEVTNADIDIFVRDSSDINEKYISDNKVTYLKETKKNGSTTLNYYYDGTIEVIKNNKSYLVRDEKDLNILGNDVTFKNDNAAKIYKTARLDDGLVIDYYEDGGAIIHDGDKVLSVRKSNSIIVKNNKLYEIVDNEYVEISNTRDGVTYYTNGAAIIDKGGNNKYYIEENSDIKYQNNKPAYIPENKETLSNETNTDNQNVKVFEHTAVITTDSYIKVVPKEKIVYDDSGKLKEIEVKIDEDIKEFQIINNTNDKIHYRVVIEKNIQRTNLDTQYIRYQIKANDNYVGPNKLDDTIWQKDELYKTLDLKGTYYVLLDSEIEPYDSRSIGIMLWTDYDTIPNAMQNKYFYGTIRVLAWSEE